MQENSDSIKELGIIAKYAYTNYDPNNSINDNRLEQSYTVKETQDTLLESSIPNLFGFQAMLLQRSDGKYVIAFLGTEGLPINDRTLTDILSSCDEINCLCGGGYEHTGLGITGSKDRTSFVSK